MSDDTAPRQASAISAGAASIGATSAGAVSVAKGAPVDNAASRIIIRLPKEADREAVRALARQLHDNTVFADIKFSDAKFDRIFDRCLAKSRFTTVLVAELTGRIIGLAWITAGEFHLGEGEILTTVHALGIDESLNGSLLAGKAFLRLVQGVRKWGNMRGAKRTLIHVTTGINMKATDRLMRAAGAKCVGGGYVV